MLFFKKKKEEEVSIETKIENVENDILDIMKECPPGGEALDDQLNQLEKLNKIRNENREADRKAKSDKWNVRLKIAGIAVSIMTFLLMLKQEITGSFRSKGLTWFWDIFKKTN